MNNEIIAAVLRIGTLTIWNSYTLDLQLHSATELGLLLFDVFEQSERKVRRACAVCVYARARVCVRV